MEWDSNTRWRQQVERRLNEIGSQVKGTALFGADRLSDVIEQIDELRKELAKDRDDKAIHLRIDALSSHLTSVSEKQETMAKWIKEKLGGKTN